MMKCVFIVPLVSDSLVCHVSRSGELAACSLFYAGSMPWGGRLSAEPKCFLFAAKLLITCMQLRVLLCSYITCSRSSCKLRHDTCLFGGVMRAHPSFSAFHHRFRFPEVSQTSAANESKENVLVCVCVRHRLYLVTLTVILLWVFVQKILTCPVGSDWINLFNV